MSIDGPLSTRGLAVTRADWFAESHELKAYFSVSRALVGPVHLVVHQRDGRVVAEAVTQVDASAGVQGTLVFALPGVTDAPVASAELK